jgi:predicted restriction endonuclease
LIASIRPGKSGTEDAVHKPLLILMLFAQAQRGGPNEFYFPDIESTLDAAIHRFGPAPRPGGPEMPFWCLKNDGFWILEDEDDIPKRKAGDRATRTGLRDVNAKGYVPLPLWQELVDTPELVENLACQLLRAFWPSSWHDAILAYVGLKISKDRRPVDG